MKFILMVSPQVGKWGAFTAELSTRSRMNVVEARSGAEAIAVVREKKTVAVAIDQHLGDMAGIDLVLKLLEINALINVALVSEQSEAAFHEETEGLGILMKLPTIPDGPAAVDFYERLTGVI